MSSQTVDRVWQAAYLFTELASLIEHRPLHLALLSIAELLGAIAADDDRNVAEFVERIGDEVTARRNRSDPDSVEVLSDHRSDLYSNLDAC